MTGLAQWAGTQTGAGVGYGGYRVRFRARPRVIDYRNFGTFLNMLGHVWGIKKYMFGYFSDMFGNPLGPFGIGLGDL